MTKYKIELKDTKTYVFDVEASDVIQAGKEAKEMLNDKDRHGLAHYYQTGETETELSNVYDVSETGDSFNPEK